MQSQQSDAAHSAFIAKHAALLTIVEVGLGSLLHGLKIPLSGQFLSLNQGFLLSRSVKEASTTDKNRFLGAQVSNVAAILKSLSPAGKKLTPMLAISAQGLLFTMGCLLLGANFGGALLGSALLSLWAFAQPILIAYFLFGNILMEASKSLIDSMTKVFPFLNTENFLAFILFFIILKILMGCSLCTLAFYGSEKKINSYLTKVESLSKKQLHTSKKPKTLFQQWIWFLKQPLFLISLGITLCFFTFSEAPKSQLAWVLLRPFAIASLFILVAPLLPLEKWAIRLQKSRMTHFGNALQIAIHSLKKKSVKENET